jgi:hypothetical protein
MMSTSSSSSNKPPHKAIFYTTPEDIEATLEYIRKSVGKDWDEPKWVSVAQFDLVSRS